jgi:hypothetical protein
MVTAGALIMPYMRRSGATVFYDVTILNFLRS